MGYSALYRTFRPQKFSEVVGQDHVIDTLKNQLKNNKVGHAYLFNGTRGTGKTSIAKIFARAINCEHSIDGEPCNECEVCKEALENNLTDIVEMDAASNNSVEDIRAIRDEVNFLPTKAKYRIYIIDEVHMLSIGAFNALLKTLEEPPEHVKFILATTEPQKIPATILSRCQRYDFKKISIENIVKRLKIVCDEQKLEYDEESLKLIAQLSDGALRDGLSILDRVIQNEMQKLDVVTVRTIVGIPSNIEIGMLVDNIIEDNVTDILVKSNEILSNGKDADKVIWEMIKYIRDILMFKAGDDLAIYNQEEKDLLKKISDKKENKYFTNLIFKLSNLENSIKMSNQKTIVFQAGILSLNYTQDSVNTSSLSSNSPKLFELEDRLGKIENYLRNKRPTKQVISQVEQKPIVVDKKDTSSTFWQAIINAIKKNGKMVLAASLTNSYAKLQGDVVNIYFETKLNDFSKTTLNKQENVVFLNKLLSQNFGRNITFKIFEKNIIEDSTGESEIEKIAKENNIDIKISD